MTGVAYRGAWTVVLLLALGNTLAFIDRMLLTMLVEPIKASLALSDTQIGMLHGMPFALFYATVGLWLGRVADRRHRPRLIAFGLIAWSLATSACALAVDYPTLFAARILVAIGEAALAPAAYALIADLFSARQLGRPLSVYQIGLYVGSGLALILGGVVAGGMTVEVAGLEGWRWTFIIAGAPGLLLGAIFLLIPEVEGRAGRAASPAGSSRFWDVLRGQWQVYAIYFSAFALIGVAVYAATAWMPTVFVRKGLSIREVGVGLGLIFVVASPLGVVAAGAIADAALRKGQGSALIGRAALGMLLLGPAVCAYCFAPTPALALVAAAATAFLLSYPFGFSALVLQLITPASVRGSASATYLLIFTLVGYGLGPTLVGLLTDHALGGEAAVGVSLSLVSSVSAAAAALVLLAGARRLAQALAAGSADVGSDALPAAKPA